MCKIHTCKCLAECHISPNKAFLCPPPPPPPFHTVYIVSQLSIPVGTHHQGNVKSVLVQCYDVALTSSRCTGVDATLHKCYDVISTLIRHCINIMCLQGYVPSICTINGFHLLSFEKINVLESCFMHRYIIIKYRLFDLG